MTPREDWKTLHAIEIAFRCGLHEAQADEGLPARHTCPYPEWSQDAHWWTRGYAYEARLLRAVKAEYEVERLSTWAGLMETINRIYPVDIFLSHAPDPLHGDPGSVILRLLREIDALRGQLQVDRT